MDKPQVADYQTETKQVACITLLNILLHIKTVVLYLIWWGHKPWGNSVDNALNSRQILRAQ